MPLAPRTAALLLTVTFALTSTAGHAGNVPRGAIRVQVLDTSSRRPLPATAVELVEQRLSSTTGDDGLVVFGNVPVGSYTIELRHTAFRPLAHRDVVVKSGQTVAVVIELAPERVRDALRREEEITVTPTRFPEVAEQPLSLVTFPYESVRRAAASAGDVSRFVSGLPSVAKVNDADNGLVVRGGSPIENGFFIDNVEVPNINHFPLQGSSGGPIGMVNVDFLENVSFHTGGFGARFGDRLSSIMELRFREGSRERFGTQLDLSFAGFGFVAEGPLSQRGSFLVSARRSFLDLLVDAIGTGVAPRYSDYQAKLTYDLDARHRLVALGILGVDSIEITRADAEDGGQPAYGPFRSREGAGGLNWQWLWSDRGYSETSLSFNGQRFEQQYSETRTSEELASDHSRETALALRT